MRFVRAKRLLIRTVGVSAVLAVATGTAAGLAPAAAAAAASSVSHTVLLVTGDRVQVQEVPNPQGGFKQTAVVRPRTGSRDAFITQQGADGDLYVIPSSALPYLGTGLDRTLFDVSALVRDGITDSVPVDVTGTAPGVSDGKITAALAPEFGAALDARFTADKGQPHAGKLFGTAESIRLAAAGAPVQVRPNYVLHTLQLQTLDNNGAPDGAQIALLNLGDFHKFDDFVSSIDGEARINVPDGDYEAAEFAPEFNGGGVVSDLRFTIRDFTVSGDTNVTLDERTATVPASFSTPRPANVVDSSAAYDVVDASGLGGIEYDFNAQNPITAYFSPSPAPVVGTRHVIIGANEVSPADVQQPYTYDLRFHADGAIGDDLHHTYTPSELTALDMGYYGDKPLTMGLSRIAYFQFEPAGVALVRYFAGPVRNTEYVVGSPDLHYDDVVVADSLADGYSPSYPRTYQSGTTLTSDYYRGPMAPGIRQPSPDWAYDCEACRQGDSLQFALAPLLDAGGHLILGDSATSMRFQLLTANGTSLLDAQNAAGGTVTVPAAEGGYRAVFDLARSGSWFDHSTASHLEWTFASADSSTPTVPDNWLCGDNTRTDCSALPLVTAAPRLDTGLDGTMPVGLGHLTVTFGHAPGTPDTAIATAKVQVSFDGGTTWQNTVLVPLGHGGYGAWWINPPSARGKDVAVRMNATDVAGNSITESVTAAYTVATQQ